ncbi:hypothetical protein D3C76_1412950 [compost metagenome]
MPRYIKDLLIEATKLSLKQGLDYINENSLHDAFHRLTRSNQRYAINPFGEDRFNYFEETETRRRQIEAFIQEKTQSQKNQKQKKKQK